MPEQEAATGAEINKNCAKCNKPLKRIKRYYRNGKYYCTRKCFKDSLVKTDKEAK